MFTVPNLRLLNNNNSARMLSSVSQLRHTKLFGRHFRRGSAQIHVAYVRYIRAYGAPGLGVSLEGLHTSV